MGLMGPMLLKTMPYTEDQLIPISALQHYVFCERQCALIHIERAWSENRFTAEGRVMHEKAHSGEGETRGALRIARSVPLRSLELGLSGVADVVEFHTLGCGSRRVLPVEYKRGKPKSGDCDRVQLCAQALCLEEMLECHIQEGALFYGKQRRREKVLLDAVLREKTHSLCESVHRLLESGSTPPPECGPKCRNCSLRELCMPEASGRSAGRYLNRQLNEACQ